MTTATQEGRNLVLRVEGIDEPFVVEPLGMKRGKVRTEDFVRHAAPRADVPPTTALEHVWIECLGVENYQRLVGEYLERDPDTDEGVVQYRTRPRREGEPELDGEPIRQEEAESLCLLAFYWQTVMGIEAVNMYIAEGEGTEASLKVTGLLALRLGLSPLTTSRSSALENLIREQAATPATSTPPATGTTVRLPANKRSIRQNERTGLGLLRRA